MSLLSAVSADISSLELANLWAEAKPILVGYIIPTAVSICIIKIIQVLSKNIQAYLEPLQPNAQKQSANEQKAN